MLILNSALTIYHLALLVKDFSGLNRFSNELPEFTELRKAGAAIPRAVPSLVDNLLRCVTQPKRLADPKWALELVAEALFRGLEDGSAAEGEHKLLRGLLNRICRSGGGTPLERTLLLGCLSSFVAALENLAPYWDWKDTIASLDVERLCRDVIEWLKRPVAHERALTMSDSVRYLRQALESDGRFITSFNESFHPMVGEICAGVLEKYNTLAEGHRRRLSFDFRNNAVPSHWRVLSYRPGLINCLANRTVDPISKTEGVHHCRIDVIEDKRYDGDSYIGFRLVTSFADARETERRLKEGQNAAGERQQLEVFGARFAEHVESPCTDEAVEGFRATHNIHVLLGFNPRRG